MEEIDVDDTGLTPTDEGIRQLSSASRLLSSQRRLHALLCLRETDRPMSLTELATEVTARERGVPREELSDRNVQATYLSLYHAHVPKLDEAGVVTFDHEVSTVDLGENRGEVEGVIDAVFGRKDPDR